ncbi:hypothetical protein EB796_013341 [Bugula neritina]|uniref:Uncharacterized protein n=1 Tax=Bugula neritina TaxID=10212 RepID=A0A7J7JRU2_BUGNE|nr:hypothetical protein EB796_013341 [Bugula neritina]
MSEYYVLLYYMSEYYVLLYYMSEYYVLLYYMSEYYVLLLYYMSNKLMKEALDKLGNDDSMPAHPITELQPLYMDAADAERGIFEGIASPVAECSRTEKKKQPCYTYTRVKCQKHKKKPHVPRQCFTTEDDFLDLIKKSDKWNSEVNKQ